MNGFLRPVLAACILFSSATGCRANVTEPMPDALRSAGLSLVATPVSLVVRPAASGRIQFRLRDEQGQPVAGYPIEFSTVGENGSGDPVPVRLSTDRALTGSDGTADLAIIADGNAAQPTLLYVQGRSPGAREASVEVRITTNTYSVSITPVAAPDLIAAGTLAKTKVFFFDDSRCSQLNLSNFTAAVARAWPPHEVNPGASWLIEGVSGDGPHAVVGFGSDARSVVRIAGCLDLAGSALLEDQTLTAILLMDHLLPEPTGSYGLVSEIGLASPTIPPISAIQATWQEWSRCPFDPARLWLDCTIDALATAPNDPDDCVPSADEGPLGAQLTSRRGVAVAPRATTPAKGATTCHDRVDDAGRPSIESVVDGLFPQGQVSAMKLDRLPSEIGNLLSAIRIHSTMQVSAGIQPNSYIVDHEVTELGLPVAEVSYKVTKLGLPVTSAHGLVAALKADQLQIPGHGFTLRLGTAANYAFEESKSLQSRGANDASSLVANVFDLAGFSDQGSLLTGCDAFDAAVSEEIGQPSGSLLDACHAGLAILAQKLSRAFDSLDGNDLDLYLRGTGFVSSASGVSLTSGFWKGEIRSRAGTCSISGQWSVTSTSTGSRTGLH